MHNIGLAEELSAYQEGLCSTVSQLFRTFIHTEGKTRFYGKRTIVWNKGTIKAVQIGMLRPSIRQCSYAL
jgi:hypothetical protein